MTSAINFVMSVLVFLANLVMQVIAFVDGLLTALMISVGIPVHLQLVILIAAAVLVAVMAIRLLGPLLMFLILVLLVLMVVHAAFPDLWLNHQHFVMPKLAL
ncbi:MAG TPA: hypothetical protein PLT25_08830 [Acidocella sp.]|nr:hypothetical protein [Acidocella sp.]